ncbi:putative RNA methyltransferase [Clostridia bacterium]|nr:putative RNA methyltransferase [Clostridia bacterium]
MSKAAECELFIEDMEFPNIGVSEYEGKKISVKHAFLGQRVRALVRRRDGRLLEVLEKSPREVSAKCKVFGICGGCAYQNLEYDKEIELKERLAQKLLCNALKDADYKGVIPSPTYDGYKNKVEFSFGDETKDGALQLGMRKRGSYYEVCASEHCNIVDSDYRKIAGIVLNFFREKGETFYHKARHTGALRHLIIRKTLTSEILVNIETTSNVSADLNELSDLLFFADCKGELKGVIHTINNGVADVVKPEETLLLRGQDYITENLLGLSFKITAFSFFQTNSCGAKLLYASLREIIQNLAPPRLIFDLYSGTGTIAQIAAPLAAQVCAIEIVPEAVLAARENAEKNGIQNVSFICGDVLREIEQLQTPPDLIIVDPPRDGVHPKALPKIAAFCAKNIIYVSCNPVTLSRDVAAFANFGYAPKTYQFVDMFPRTYHIETIVLLISAPQVP